MAQADSDRPVLFLLHGLGGSARTWQGVAAALADAFETVAIDLPGFGGTAPAPDPGVLGLVDAATAAVRARGASRWLLVGHSMGGKIASVLASRALQGESGLFGLAGVVLLAGSPPSPEPMDESRRAQMIGWASAGPLHSDAARTFIDANVGAPLSAQADALAMADLQRVDPEAWVAWLERGSREDWSAVVGSLDLPALIVVGSEDGDLGAEGQRKTNAHVYPRSHMRVEQGAGHLLPLERPLGVADAIRRFWLDVAGTGPRVPQAFAQLMASDRVSRRTRGVLAQRVLADVPDGAPKVMTAAQLTILRAVAARVVPQPAPSIDLAARLDAQLATGQGDGWRFAALPCDREAYADALDALSHFPALDADAQDNTLRSIAAGGFSHPGARLSATQMQHWFEDARTDLARLWLAHPATLASIGYDGFANGGDGVRKQGFQRTGLDQWEAWEPLPAVRQ